MSLLFPKLRRVWVAIILIVMCSVPELALQGADLGLWGSAQWRALAYDYGAFWGGLLHEWRPNYAAQPYAMFITYAFLHAGLGHLLVNMITLYSLGGEIIRRAGQANMLLIYSISIIGGAVGFGVLGPIEQPMVGASGALFGLVGAWLTWDVWAVVRANPTLMTLLYALLWPVTFIIGLNLIMYWASQGFLAWETHLGGVLAGAVTAALLLVFNRTTISSDLS